MCGINTFLFFLPFLSGDFLLVLLPFPPSTNIACSSIHSFNNSLLSSYYRQDIQVNTAKMCLIELCTYFQLKSVGNRTKTELNQSG